jgi:hypothetical protein
VKEWEGKSWKLGLLASSPVLSPVLAASLDEVPALCAAIAVHGKDKEAKKGKLSNPIHPGGSRASS